MLKNNIVIDLRLLKSSGIGTYINSLVPYILDNIDNVHFYLLFQNKKNNNLNFQRNNVTIVNIYSSIYSINEQFEIQIKIPKYIDLYWSPHYVFPVMLNTKILLTVHDLYHYYKSKNYLKSLYMKFMLRYADKKVNKIICVSNYTKKNILPFINDHKKIDVIYNGLDKYWYNKHCKRDNIILTVGNLKYNKNIITLVKAFLSIKNQINDDLYIVGEFKNIKNKCNEALKLINNSDRIHLFSNLKKKELLEYYNKSKLYVHPSIYEGFGYTMIEALKCGCPVLASNAACIPEICKNFVTYFNPYNINELSVKMLKILKNKKQIYDSNSIDLTSMYNLDEMRKKTKHVIENLLK